MPIRPRLTLASQRLQRLQSPRAEGLLQALSTVHGEPSMAGLQALQTLCEDLGDAEPDEARDALLHDAEQEVLLAALEAQLSVAIAAVLGAVSRLYAFERAVRHQVAHPLETWIEAGPFSWFRPHELVAPEHRLEVLQVALSDNLCALGGLQRQLSALRRSEGEAANAWALLAGLRLYGLQPGVARLLEPAADANATGEAAAAVPLAMDHGAGVPTGLRDLGRRLAAFLPVAGEFEAAAVASVAAARPRSLLRRKWLQLTLAAAGAVAAGLFARRHAAATREWARKAAANGREFLQEHLVEPATIIFDDVFLNKHPPIADAAALADAKESLGNMLADYCRDEYPDMPAEECARVVREMDMSVVSRQYEAELPRAIKNIVTGDIVRLLLIQVQFLKKELQVALAAIEELLNDNQFNLQVMATVPALLALSGTARALRWAYHKLTATRDRGGVARDVRDAVRDIERLLTVASALSPELEGSRTALATPRRARVTPLRFGAAAREELSEHDLGLLLLLVHRIRALVGSRGGLVHREHLAEDLQDLLADELPLAAKRSTIRRMYHTHKVLQLTQRSLF